VLLDRLAQRVEHVHHGQRGHDGVASGQVVDLLEGGHFHDRLDELQIQPRVRFDVADLLQLRLELQERIEQVLHQLRRVVIARTTTGGVTHEQVGDVLLEALGPTSLGVVHFIEAVVLDDRPGLRRLPPTTIEGAIAPAPATVPGVIPTPPGPPRFVIPTAVLTLCHWPS
jgi:hypothetical protein